MARVQLRIHVETTYTLETENYADAWQQYCDDSGDMEEGDEYPPVDEAFAIEQFQENLENGDEDLLSLVLEDATVNVSKVC